MSLKIRLKQLSSNQHYRIILIDSKRPRDGRMLKPLGYYSKAGRLYIDVDEVAFWMAHGAQPSTPMARILQESGLMDKNVLKLKLT